MPIRMHESQRSQAGSARRLTFVVLRDHARLPSRFFGRLTASVQAAL